MFLYNLVKIHDWQRLLKRSQQSSGIDTIADGISIMKERVQEIFAQRPITQQRYPLPEAFNRYAHYLTQREALIVSRLVKGKRAKEIAWELESSLHTVNTHLANIKQKLGCKSIFELGMTLGEIKVITAGEIEGLTG